MILIVLWACADPPMLDRVAEASAAEVVDDAERAIGLFVTIGAVIAEPCAADTLDGYTLVGQGYRAFHVVAPNITVSEAGERTYAYGTLAFLGDVGDLTLTSDEGRRQWTARFDGAEGGFSGQYLATECEVDDAGVVTRSALTGNGTYTPTAGDEQDLTIEEAGGPLTWAPGTAAVPSTGEVTWHVSKQKVEIELGDASGIDPVEFGWPGVAAGGGWTADVKVTLP